MKTHLGHEEARLQGLLEEAVPDKHCAVTVFLHHLWREELLILGVAEHTEMLYKYTLFGLQMGSNSQLLLQVPVADRMAVIQYMNSL